MTGHDWAAIIGADLETGDPPIAYCCQGCGRVIPGQIVMVSRYAADDAWLIGWLSLPENAAAEVRRVEIPPGAAYVADPRAVELSLCLPAARRTAAAQHSQPFGKVKIT